MADLTDAVRAALTGLPFTTRAKIAEAAGVSHTLLNGIVNGTRNATPDVAAKVAAVLESWARDCQDAAHGVRRALPRKGRHER